MKSWYRIFLAVNRPALELAGAGKKLIPASSSDAPSVDATDGLGGPPALGRSTSR